MTDHLTRVARMATALAQTARLNPMFATTIDEPFVNTLNACAILHDIGNLALPDDLLHASDPTEAMDFHTLQTHTTIGAETLAGVARRDKDASAFWRMAIDIARHHHERFDGQGYPDRLAGSDIPLAARIVAIADSYDDLRTPHTLGVAVPHDAAIEHMIRDAGKRFDPNLIESLRACQGEFETLFGN